MTTISLVAPASLGRLPRAALKPARPAPDDDHAALFSRLRHLCSSWQVRWWLPVRLRDEEAGPVLGGTETSCRVKSYSGLGGCTSAMPRADAIGGWRSLSWMTTGVI